jgi:restriction system protein
MGPTTPVKIPQYHELMWPALQATKALGGSATVREMNERVIEELNLSEDQQAVAHGEGRMSELEYRLHWARTHLKGLRAMENSTRGVWAITDHGLAVTEKQMHAETKVWRAAKRAGRKARRDNRQESGDESADDLGPTDEETEATWKDELIGRLVGMSPAAFERLTQRILREAGFINVIVTGKSGDGGIDGMGTYRPSLVSFPVYFQCKRYRGSVPPSAVRDFRGAMSGRGEKGLLITTGSFSADAQKEASRDGAPPIDLVDGDRLCDLLRDYRLGVEVTVRQIEDVSVKQAFFDEFA